MIPRSFLWISSEACYGFWHTSDAGPQDPDCRQSPRGSEQPPNTPAKGCTSEWPLKHLPKPSTAFQNLPKPSKTPIQNTTSFSETSKEQAVVLMFSPWARRFPRRWLGAHPQGNWSPDEAGQPGSTWTVLTNQWYTHLPPRLRKKTTQQPFIHIWFISEKCRAAFNLASETLALCRSMMPRQLDAQGSGSLPPAMTSQRAGRSSNKLSRELLGTWKFYPYQRTLCSNTRFAFWKWRPKWFRIPRIQPATSTS